MDPLYSQIPTLRVFSTIEDPSNIGNRLVMGGVITGVPPTSYADVFGVSCVLQRDDSSIVYKNAGTVAVPSWSEFDTSTGGLPALTDGDVWVGNGSDVATAVTLSGDVTISNTGVATVDAIDLETATVTGIADTEILIGTGAGTAAFATLSGDVTISNTGVATVDAIDLETATVTGIADTEILIGTGAGTAAFATLSGDVTISNTGVATVDAIDLETATVTGIADTEILIGTGAGTAAFATLSGDVTISNTGVATIGSGVVEKTMLATGVKANFMDMFLDDSFTTVGGAAAEVISVPGVVGTDKVIVSLYDAGTNTVSIASAVAGTDQITVTFSADPGNDAVIAYVVKRATA
jgi:hypothetical protein